MKKTLYLLSFASLMAASCTTKNNVTPTPTPPTPTAPSTNVMYVNAYNAGSISIQANDTITPSNSLAYNTNTGYINMPPGTLRSVFSLLPAEMLITENTTSVTADAHYTIFLCGSLAAVDNKPATVLTVADNISTPATGKARFRFINLAVGNYTESVKMDTSLIASSLGYQTITNFVEIPAGVHNIAADNINHPTVTNITNFVAGKSFTMMLTGKYIDATHNTLKLTAIENN